MALTEEQARVKAAYEAVQDTFPSPATRMCWPVAASSPKSTHPRC